MDHDNPRPRGYTARWGTLGMARLGAAAVLCAATLTAQTFTLNPLTSGGVQQAGLHLYNFSVYSQYSTVGQSWINLLNELSGTTATSLPGHMTASGASLAVGLHFGGVEDGRSDFSLLYAPTYSYTTYGQKLSQFTHSVALSWSRKLVPRWQLSISASAVEGSFEQIIFSPTSGQNVDILGRHGSGTGGADSDGTDHQFEHCRRHRCGCHREPRITAFLWRSGAFGAGAGGANLFEFPAAKLFG